MPDNIPASGPSSSSFIFVIIDFPQFDICLLNLSFSPEISLFSLVTSRPDSFPLLAASLVTSPIYHPNPLKKAHCTSLLFFQAPGELR